MVAEIEARYCAGVAQGGRDPIFRPGASGWYALTVAPQREDQAEAWLARRGVYGFHPVLTRKRRRFGRVVEHHRRYLPGYVFARFVGAPVVHAVLSCPFVTGAITLADGRWGVLDPAGLRAIHAMRRRDAEAEAARRAAAARQRRARMLSVGDAAMFRSGPFSGFRCEVVDLPAGGGATVRLVLFGREVVTPADGADLVPMQKRA